MKNSKPVFGMPSSRTNVILILIDDMGVHQLESYGSTFYETPNIDRLAREGMRFTDAYGTGPVCSPSRASIMTGKYPARLHLTNFIPGSVPPNPKLITPPWQQFLPLEERTLGNAFQENGYVTGHFGKWHLAKDYNHHPGRSLDPESQGFEEVKTSVKPKPGADPLADAHNTRRITDWALDFLERHKADPFLCVLEHNAIHNPEMEDPDLIAKYARKAEADADKNRPVLGAMVETLDKNIGRLLDKLDALGLAESSLVVFNPDHGMKGESDSLKPLRGSKANLYEGGIRVPLLFRWPREISPATVSRTMVCGNDLFPTLLEAIGEEANHPEIDGLSLLPLLKGNGTLDREALFWHYPHYHHQGLAPSGAVRAGDYKLIEWFEQSLLEGPEAEGALELFNLKEDISEQRNLIREEREKGETLYRMLKSWRRAVGAQEMTVNPAYDPSKGGEDAPKPGWRKTIPE